MHIHFFDQIHWVVTFFPVFYVGWMLETEDSITNTMRGFVAVCWIIVMQGIQKNPVEYAKAPAPAFWRSAGKVCLCYLLVLVFVIFQRVPDGRDMLKHIDPIYGKRVTKGMHTYDDNCEFQWENLYDNMDHYFAIHLINWFLASLIVRDSLILHVWSILDEILGTYCPISLRSLNFWE